MSRAVLAALALAWLGLAACGRADETPQPRPTQGREETRNIRNTEAIGYSGDAIADKVDAALDANDRRIDQLDADIDAQTQ